MMLPFYHGGGGLRNLFRRNLTGRTDIPPNPLFVPIPQKTDTELREMRQNAPPLSKREGRGILKSGAAEQT